MNGCAVELEIVGDLRGAIQRVIEVVVVAMDEDEGVALVVLRRLKAIRHEFVHLKARQRTDLRYGEVRSGILALVAE